MGHAGDSGAGARDAVDVDALAAAITSGDRTALARAITLVESRRPVDRATAAELQDRLDAHTGGSHRVGISGLPGVGKSTLIDALGMRLVEAEKRLAVLAVDPSSRVSGGSILGDKTRMGRLARQDKAFIRPSPAAHDAGGVAARTHEVILLCEAAGFDVVLVETVGVGQSETRVADIVDTFVAMMLPGAGDELQAIKKGLIELADIVVVNKADGNSLAAARETASEYAAALRYARRGSAAWRPRAVMSSARSGEGIAELWALIEDHHASLEASGELAERRREQLRRRLWNLLDERLIEDFRSRHATSLAALEARVLAGEMTPSAAAAEAVRDDRSSSRQP